MAGNTFGKTFTVTTFGESHGPSIGAIVDGCPPGLPLNESDLQRDLDRRRPGQSKYTTQRDEADEVRILSGRLRRRNHRHADWTDHRQYRSASRDYSKIQASSVRRTPTTPTRRNMAFATIAAAVALRPEKQPCAWQQAQLLRNILHSNSVRRCAATLRRSVTSDRHSLIGTKWNGIRSFVPTLPSCPRLPISSTSCARTATRSAHALPSLPAACRLVLGEPVFDKLDADIARALMGINAVKGVELGAGFDVVKQRGTEHRDEMTAAGFPSNNAGGVLGGISTGQDIVASMALKPTSSLRLPGRSLNDRAKRSKWSRPADTIRAWVFVRRRSPRRCLRWC